MNFPQVSAIIRLKLTQAGSIRLIPTKPSTAETINLHSGITLHSGSYDVTDSPSSQYSRQSPVMNSSEPIKPSIENILFLPITFSLISIFTPL